MQWIYTLNVLELCLRHFKQYSRGVDGGGTREGAREIQHINAAPLHLTFFVTVPTPPATWMQSLAANMQHQFPPTVMYHDIQE